MARSSPFKKNQVSPFIYPLACGYISRYIVVKKDWTVAEWLSAFLDAEIAGWDIGEPDDYDDPIPGGDDYLGDDIESEILESLVILALTGALALLLYYRTQRQRRQEEERRRQQQQQQQQHQRQHAPAQAQAPIAQQQQQGQPQQQQDDRGMFPQPGDPEYLNWVAGGVGH